MALDPRGPLDAIDALAAFDPSAAARLAPARVAIEPARDSPLVLQLALAQWRPATTHALPPTRAPATLEDALRLLAADRADEVSVPAQLDLETSLALRDMVVATLLLQDAAAVPGADAGLYAAARDAALAIVLDAAPRLQRAAAPPMTLCPRYSFDLEGVDSTHVCDVALLVDVGGDDLYLNNAGATDDSVDFVGAIALDLAGDDTYANANDGRKAFGGSASIGVGMLFDLAGNDLYDARFQEGGTAFGSLLSLGAALHYDAEGDDSYGWTMTPPPGSPGGDVAAGMGSAAGAGAALLFDGDGHDIYSAPGVVHLFYAAIGGARGVGASALLYEGGGDDRYHAASGPTFEFGAMGAATTRGTAVLIDAGGANEYDATVAPMARGGALGAGQGGAVGALFDLEGAATFVAGADGHGGTMGAGVQGVGLFYAGAADTTYVTRGRGAGVGHANGVGILVDDGGENSYESDVFCTYASTAEAALPTPRNHLSAVYGADAAYIFGGVADPPTLGAQTARSISADIVRFDPVTNLTTLARATLPGPRADTAAVWTGTRALVFGGFDGIARLDAILEYDPVNDTIQTLPTTLPTARSHMAAVWTGERALLFGGVDDSGEPLDDILSYDPANDTLVTLSTSLPQVDPGAPAGLYGVHAAWNGDFVALLGGRPGGGVDPSDRTWRFYPGNGTLEEGPLAPQRLYGGATVVHDGKAYVLGYSTEFEAQRHIFEYDFATGSIQWMQGSWEYPVEDAWGAAVSDGTHVYQFTNRTGESGRSVFAFDPAQELCPRASAQGAGSNLGVGVLLDRGDEASFALARGVTGQGAGVQGVGLLRRQPQGGQQLSTYGADEGSTPMGIAGAGISLRLDEGFYVLVGDVRPNFTCGSAAALAPTITVPDTAQVALCSRDESTRRPILDSEGKPMEPARKRALGCADIDEDLDCEEPFEDDDTLRRVHAATLGFLGRDEVTMTTEGGIAIFQGRGMTLDDPDVLVKVNQMSADDMCEEVC